MERSTIEDEIARLAKLEKEISHTWEGKKAIASFVTIPSEQFMLCKEYYENGLAHLKMKRRFWSQFRDNSFDKNSLNKVQETLNDWLMTGWAYFGMKEHKEQAEQAIEEFEMFKRMFEVTPKKKTRRGGRK